jgi:hypothetical protein
MKKSLYKYFIYALVHIQFETKIKSALEKDTWYLTRCDQAIGLRRVKKVQKHLSRVRVSKFTSLPPKYLRRQEEIQVFYKDIFGRGKIKHNWNRSEMWCR